jgi:hypothetical protein
MQYYHVSLFFSRLKWGEGKETEKNELNGERQRKWRTNLSLPVFHDQKEIEKN